MDGAGVVQDEHKRRLPFATCTSGSLVERDGSISPFEEYDVFDIVTMNALGHCGRGSKYPGISRVPAEEVIVLRIAGDRKSTVIDCTVCPLRKLLCKRVIFEEN